MQEIPIRERLSLDHFYISVTADEIASLSPMTSNIRGSSHDHVLSGTAHWEGIYILGRLGDYFEIVLDPKASPLGLAFSAAKPQYTDVRRIAEELPNLDWQRGSRLTESNAPWFDWLSLTGDTPAKAPSIYCWVMHYHFSHWPRSWVPSAPRVIDRFKKIELSMGRELVSELKSQLPWLPGSQTWGESQVVLTLPLRDGHVFEAAIALVEGVQPLAFHALEFEVTKGQSISPGVFGPFSLTESGSQNMVFRKRGEQPGG